MSGRDLFNLADIHPLIICEGTAEEVIVDKLLSKDAFVFPASNIISVTRLRKAEQIQDRYLSYDYEWPVTLLRILDSRKERFRLGNLYRDRFEVVNIITHPEIDVLAIIREGQWERWKASRKKPSVFCKEDLSFHGIKSKKFLESYWTIEELITAIFEYKRITKPEKTALVLADIVKKQKSM